MRVNLRAKLEVLSAFVVFVFSMFALQAGAQGVNAYSVYNPQNNLGVYRSYYMGSVNLPGSNYVNYTPVQTVQTNLVPIVVTAPIVCTNYLTSFHKYGDRGVDVAALQNFLNQYNGANLNGKGFYGPATQKAVQNLQLTYGIRATGSQYEKTTALINGLKCGTVMKRTPMVYTGVKISPKVNLSNVYPNPNVYEPVKNYGTKPTANTTMMPATTPANSMNSNATNSLAGNMDSDFQKIKDNYKAYILVFVLVLALFWFLRKAATE